MQHATCSSQCTNIYQRIENPNLRSMKIVGLINKCCAVPKSISLLAWNWIRSWFVWLKMYILHCAYTLPFAFSQMEFRTFEKMIVVRGCKYIACKSHSIESNLHGIGSRKTVISFAGLLFYQGTFRSYFQDIMELFLDFVSLCLVWFAFEPNPL